MSDAVAQIKARLDLVEFIGSYLKLKRSGSNHVGLCPFHGEKTPSFNVSQNRQAYHCFGCGASGDIFSFVMAYENMTFRESLEKLAPIAGVELESNSWNHQNGRKEKTWKRVLNFAGHFFRSQFLSEAGSEARSFLQNRGFTDDTLDLFKIGYAPNTWSSLMDEALKKGFQLDDLITMGLVRKNNNGKCYDFFRHRVIFPVRNAQGQVVAFGGRVLDGSEPKYLNTPETPLFNKSRLLFNFTQARGAMSEHQCFLMMEGYTDVMMATQVNCGPAVATLGTAMTEEHVRLLNRHDVPLYLVYDGDRAGQKAMERALPFVLKLGVNARAIALPQGQDPADFITQNEDWKNQWEELKANSLDLFEYKLKAMISEKGLEQAESKISIAKAMIAELRLNRDDIREGVYLDVLSRELDVQRDDLLQQLNKQKATSKPIDLKPKLIQSSFRKDPPFFLLSLTMVDQGYRARLEEIPTLPENTQPTTQVLKKWLQAHHDEGDIAHGQFEADLSALELEVFQQARIQELPAHHDLPTFFEEKLKQWQGAKNGLAKLNDDIAKAEAAGDHETLVQLLKAKSEALRSKE